MRTVRWARIGMAACLTALAMGVLSAQEATDDLAQLKAQVSQQQRQIEELSRKLEEFTKFLVRITTGGQRNLGEVASTTPIILLGSSTSSPASTVAFPAAAQPVIPAPAPDAIQKTIEKINGNLRGFQFSGDLRFRFDLLDRQANPSFPSTDNRSTPQQRARERYRVRFNIDKDLFSDKKSEKDNHSLAHFHLQLATDPYSNPITMDTDFSGIATRAPFSIAEAYLDLTPLKGLTFRAGRTRELFADDRQFVYDDDIRFNGFHEIYHWNAKKNGVFFEVKAAQYILTDPNIQVAPPASGFLAAGYKVGQRIPSANLFDQGITVGSNLGKKWSHNEFVNYFVVREPNQIQLASTASGVALFANNPIVGATLIGNLGGTGNATTSAAGTAYFASEFHVVRGGFNLNYSGLQWRCHNFPFQLFLQGTHNTGASIDQNGYMAGASFGQAARLGDVQLQYQYFYKPANAFISQFTDDDVGTGSGVNVKTHELRVNFGLNRFLMWETRLYIQHGISVSNPAINYFLPLPQGYRTQFRLHSQFVFTF